MKRTILTSWLLFAPLAHAGDTVYSMPASKGWAQLSARDHYDRGVALYSNERYREALAEFEEAREAQDLPELSFNIGRCLEHLTRNREAAAAYRLYLATAMARLTPDEVVELQDKIKKLETWTPTIVAPWLDTVARKTIRAKQRTGLIVLGSLGLAFTVTGAGLLGSTATDYSNLHTSCAPLCSTSSWAGLPGREHGGEAMLGLGGAAVAGALIWLIVEIKK